MRKGVQKLLFVLLFLAKCAMAAPFYGGVQIGHGVNLYQSNHLSPGYSAVISGKTGVAPRVLLGYRWSRFVLTELSVVFFQHVKFADVQKEGSSTKWSKVILSNLTSLSLLASLPLSKNDHASVNVRLGVGFTGRTGIKAPDGDVVLSEGSIIRPILGVGGRWQFYRGWFAGLSWIFSPGSKDNHLPAAEYLGAGLGYQFT